jgi:hypothetical protein
MKRVVMCSGGIGSWAAGKRVAMRHGTDGLVNLFADTKMEDEDLYRFLPEAAANVGGELVVISDGRDPWQVFFDRRFLGNTRADPCSEELKRFLCRRWVKANCDPANTVLYVGIDWTENRLERIQEAWLPWRVEGPMCEEPYATKAQMLESLSAEGIAPPRLYAMGFPHNNCGGFCIKAGQAHFALLLKKLPDRYAYHEGREQELRSYLGKDVAILRDRRGGKTRPLTLREFRERIQGGEGHDLHEWGGCGCFADPPKVHNEAL